MFKIFLSSNRMEFYEERKRIKDAIEDDIILNRFFKVFSFEEEPASGKDPVKRYSEAVLESDIYIGLIGSKYGTVLETGFSPTETEYNLFTDDENTYFFLKDVYNREEKTEEFIKRIQDKHSYQIFSDRQELIIEIKRSLGDFLDRNLNNIKKNYDKRILKNSSIDDLDDETYELFFNIAKDESLKELKDIRSKEEILALINAGEIIDGKFYFNIAGALCFAKDLEKFDIEHEIKMVKFNSDDRTNIMDENACKVNIFKLLKELEFFHNRHTTKSTIIRGFDGINVPEYPFGALREGIINAFAHRDYSIDISGTTCYFYNNRIEIISPGKLLSPLNIENLGMGNPVHRNKNICYILSKTKHMEHVGTGIIRMKKIMKSVGLKEPEFIEFGEFFKVVLWGRDEDFDIDEIQSNKIDLINEFDLNERQVKALEYMYNKNSVITVQKYYEHFNISRTAANRDIKDLIEKNLITKEIKKNKSYFKAKKGPIKNN